MGDLSDKGLNSRTSAGTAIRLGRDPNPQSGMCSICIRDCKVLCTISKAAFRGHEVIYPEPQAFGASTASGNKDYGIDWSHFQLMASLQGAQGIEADSDKALFINVDTSTVAGGVPLKVPIVIPGLGSTAVAKRNWEGLSMGASLIGALQVVGENVCGMDGQSKFKTVGKRKQVTASPDMKFRIDSYRKFWDGTHGDIAVQTNVEDQRLGVDVYALSKLEVNVIERKWGQGAKAIGGEVRLTTLERAKLLHKRGYIVLPDPTDKKVEEAFKDGVFQSFERHSRVGMPEHPGMMEDFDWLKDQGAKRIFLKTGAYRPEAVAFTLKVASDAKVDLMTFDGAGGGTGMSPIPHMCDLSTPTVYLFAQVLEGCRILKEKGRHVPDLAIAGGMIAESQMVKAIAMSNIDGSGPIVKAIGMARSPLTAAMKADYFVELAAKGGLPKGFVREYGDDPEKFFIATTELKRKLGSRYASYPKSAVGVYTYFHKLQVGMRQLMAGMRKWKVELLDRDGLRSLSPLAEEVSGIPMPHRDVEKILKRLL